MGPLDTAPSVDDGEPFGVAPRREEVLQQNAAVVCTGSSMRQRAGVAVDERAAALEHDARMVTSLYVRSAALEQRTEILWAAGFATACLAPLPGAGSLCSGQLARRHLQ